MKTSVLKSPKKSQNHARKQPAENHWPEALNFQRLIHYFNQLSEETGTRPLQLKGNQALGTSALRGRANSGS
jgi:hypothetical protein